MEAPVGLLILIGVLAIAAVLVRRLAKSQQRSGKNVAAASPAELSDRKVAIVVGGDTCEVVGESKFQRELEAIAGGRTALGANHKCIAVLRPEPTNRHDKNAVQVEVGGYTVGYLPRAIAAGFVEALHEEGFLLAVCNATIVGGWLATKKQEQGHFGIVLDACVPFEFDL
jgi:hypothetical protein